MIGQMRKAMVYLGLSDEDYEEFDQRSDANNQDRNSNSDQQQAQRSGADYSRGTTTIRPMTRTEPQSQVSGSVATLSRPTVVRNPEPQPEAVRVHVIEPIEFGDAQEIGDRLKENQPVIITLSDVEADLARRLIDFCSGATYVLGGTMERVSKNVFLLTPSNVEVPPEEKQRLRERGLYRN